MHSPLLLSNTREVARFTEKKKKLHMYKGLLFIYINLLDASADFLTSSKALSWKLSLFNLTTKQVQCCPELLSAIFYCFFLFFILF